MLDPPKTLLAVDGRGERLFAPGLADSMANQISRSDQWEVEIGFGKARYLLDSAAQTPAVSFLGIELAGEYFRRAARWAARLGLTNLLLLRGEAHYLMAAVLPRQFARSVHVYFPDPWPKSRHRKRRLLDAGTVDLLLGLLRPGGRLLFATDHPRYGAKVTSLLESHPALSVESRGSIWDGGPRTNYEAKYVAEGRPIVRLEAVLVYPDRGLVYAERELLTVAATFPTE